MCMSFIHFPDFIGLHFVTMVYFVVFFGAKSIFPVFECAGISVSSKVRQKLTGSGSAGPIFDVQNIRNVYTGDLEL